MRVRFTPTITTITTTIILMNTVITITPMITTITITTAIPTRMDTTTTTERRGLPWRPIKK